MAVNKYTNGMVLLLALTVHGHAQMNQFFGGRNKIRYRGAISYEGASALGEMAGISTLYSSTGSVFCNPAGILQINRLQVQTDISLPGLGINTSTHKSARFRSFVQNGLDQILPRETTEDMQRKEPEIHTDMAQTPGLEGLGIAYRTDFFKWPVAFSGAFEKLADFQLNLEMNDVIVGFGLPLSGPNPSVDSLKAKFNGNSELSLQLGLNRRGAAIAVEHPNSGLKFGFSVHQYMGYFNCGATGEIDGLISKGHNESYFNLETSPYTDDLNFNYLGTGNGSAAGFGMGVNWMFSKHFGIDLAANWNGNIKQGGIYGEYFIPHAMDRDGPETENVQKKSGNQAENETVEDNGYFDVSKLNMAKPTLTKKVTNQITNVSLRLPARLGASFCIDFKKFKMNLDYAWYYKDFVLSYDYTNTKTAFDPEFKDIILKTDGTDSIEVETGSGKLGFPLSQKVVIGLFYSGFFMNSGAYIGNPSIFFQNDMEINIRFIPIFNIGYCFRPQSRITADFSLVQLPMTVFKTTLKYRI